MKKAHFILQAKGGVGKSFVASLLAQMLKSETNIDLDQSNPTFGGYEALNVKHIAALTTGFTVDAGKFDQVVEILLESKLAVIDTGANSFAPLMDYIVENGVFDLLADSGVEVTVHTIVAGGAELNDTALGFDAIAGHAPRVVLWLNEHFGDTQLNDKPFTESKTYQAHASKVAGIVTLPRLNPQTTGADIARLVKMRQTFKEAPAHFRIMEQHRLARYLKGITEQFVQIKL
jgi:hypothetical protein